MVDYIKIDISHVQRVRLERDGLVFAIPGYFDTTTGQIVKAKKFKAEYEASCNGLTFKEYKSGKRYLEGSLHKYWNLVKGNGNHNYNQFTRSDLLEIVNDLRGRFGIDPDLAIIRHIEYGVNLSDLPFTASQIVDNAMIHHTRGGKPAHYKYANQSTPSEYKIVDRDKSKHKLYNKGLQYGLNDNILRNERKDNDMTDLKRLGIITLSDMTTKRAVGIMLDRLLSQWDSVLFSDWTIREGELTKAERNKLKDWRNPTYWTELHLNSRDRNRNRFSREIKQYGHLVMEHGNRVHAIIKAEIIYTWQRLTSNEPCRVLSQKVQLRRVNALSELHRRYFPKGATSPVYNRRTCTFSTTANTSMVAIPWRRIESEPDLTNQAPWKPRALSAKRTNKHQEPCTMPTGV